MGISCRVAAAIAGSHRAIAPRRLIFLRFLDRIAGASLAQPEKRQPAPFPGISPELSVTSVASEASAISHSLAKTQRTTRPTGMRPDGAFAALMDIETRPEPKPAAKPAAPAQARDAAKPAEKAEECPVPDEAVSAPAPNDANRTEPVEGAKDEALSDVTSAAVTEGAADPDPAPAATAVVAPALPAVEPPPAPAIAAVITPQAAPETAAPETADSLEAAGPTAPAASPASPAPQAPKPVTPDEAAQASAQLGKPARQAKASATPADGNAGVASPEASEEVATQAEAPETPAPKQTKALPAQAAPVRPDATTGKSETRPDFVVKPEDPAPSAKPGIDLAAQIATPAHAAHPASAQAAAPQAAPVSAAQPVPVNALAVEIAAQARAGNSRFEIRLDPPELGRIDVRLDVDRDGNVTSRLVIERADTYDLLRRDQSTLERALQQAGLKTSDNALEFSLRDQGFAQHRDSDELPRGLQAVIQEAETTPGEAASGYARLLGARGGIDIRV
jgi:flagellar hook-length control protein FliK